MDLSSLASLKAELARKKNEAHLVKKSQGPKDPKQGSKTDLIWRKNKEKDKSAGNHSGSSSKIPQEEEVRVQAALEMKAKLYDKIKSGQVEDKLGVYLVNFKKDDSAVEDEEPMQDPLSESIRHENIRKKWEEEERENLNKTDIHYQDVLFNEARDHGTAFYRFSKDAEERAKEMSDLRRLREETERERVEKDASKKDRNEAMKKRLKKIKDKKRQKMGLPPVESDEEPIKEEPTINVQEEIMQRLKLLREEQADEERKKNVKEWDIGKTENMLNEKPFERKVLSQEEWVEAKRAERPSEFAPFYQQQSHRKNFSRNSVNVGNDEDWYDEEDNYQQPKKKRKKKKKKKNRQQQFQHNQNTMQEPVIESASSSSSESSPELDLSKVPLPPDPSTLPQNRFQNFDFSSLLTPNITSGTDGSSGVIYPPVNDLHTNVYSVPVPRTYQPTSKANIKFNVKLLYNNGQSSSSYAPDVSLESRLNLHKNMTFNTDKAIVNELDAVNLPTPSVREDVKRTGVEIPPPCDMEYFSSTSKVNKRSHWQGSRSLKELNESFQAGLSQRKKMTVSADKESKGSDEAVN